MYTKQVLQQIVLTEFYSFFNKCVITKTLRGTMKDMNGLPCQVKIDLNRDACVKVISTEPQEVLKWKGMVGSGRWIKPRYRVELKSCWCEACCLRRDENPIIGDLSNLMINGTSYGMDGRVARGDVLCWRSNRNPGEEFPETSLCVKEFDRMFDNTFGGSVHIAPV